MHQHRRIDDHHPSLKSADAVNKEPISQTVLSLRSKSDCPTSSTVQSVGSDVNIFTSKVPLPSKVNKPKKNDKETASQRVNSSKNIFDLKRQEFFKFRKQFLQQQNKYLHRYAQLREMETRLGNSGLSTIGEVRVLSVTDWSMHDLRLLAAASAPSQPCSEIKEDLGLKIIKKQTAQVREICEDIVALGTELLKRRSEILKLLRAIQRNGSTNIQWQAKSAELDEESIQLQELVSSTVKNVEAKLTQNIDTAKISWMYRDNMIKKMERLQRDFLQLKKSKLPEDTNDKKKILEELQRERMLCVKLKDMLASAEDRVTAARARCAELERQLSHNTARSKWPTNPKRLHIKSPGSSQDVNLKKTDLTIETLNNQRDELQLKLKELQNDAAIKIQEAEKREMELTSHLESLLSELEKQEQEKESFEKLATETKNRLKDLQNQYNMLEDRSRLLVDAQHMNCLEYLPNKESTYNALRRRRPELKCSSAEKTDLQEQPKVEVAEDEVNEEQTISKLQNKIDELMEDKKTMQESLTWYEDQISGLRLQVSLMRGSKEYKCCDQDTTHEELQKQVFDLCLQVEQLTREREALESEANTRALLLERHERCAELFASVTRARRDLAAHLAVPTSTAASKSDATFNHEMLNLMSKSFRSSARTWSALRAERSRVLRLEEVVRAQAQQLERESHVRVKQDRQRALLERELLRTWAGAGAASGDDSGAATGADSGVASGADSGVASGVTSGSNLQQTARKEAITFTSDSLFSLNTTEKAES